MLCCSLLSSFSAFVFLLRFLDVFDALLRLLCFALLRKNALLCLLCAGMEFLHRSRGLTGIYEVLQKEEDVCQLYTTVTKMTIYRYM